MARPLVDGLDRNASGDPYPWVLPAGEHETPFENKIDCEEWLACGAWKWDVDSDRMICSRGMERLLDGEAVTTMKCFQDHIVENDRSLFGVAFDRTNLNRKEGFSFNFTLITHLQNEKVFSTRGKLVLGESGLLSQVIGVMQDITEQSAVIRDLSGYKRMTIEHEDLLGHGSWEWNLQSKTAIWSDGMYRIFGYEPDSDKPRLRVDADLFRFHLGQGNYELNMNRLDKAVMEGAAHYIRNFEIIIPDKDSKMLESYGTIVYDRNGRGLKVIGTTKDITQSKRKEQDLERRMTDLDRLNMELEHTTLVTSHDLQEPLRKIVILSDQLQKRFESILPEDGKKYLKRIQSATKSAKELMDSLLEFSQIGGPQSFKITDLGQLMEEVSNDLELRIAETQTTMRIGHLPTVEVSYSHIKQLFSNIILNAIKFRKMDQKAMIDIQSRALEPEEVRNFALDHGSYFMITVMDNGIGFEASRSSEIFQMFKRLHGRSAYPGFGIGLAFCKKIVENHGGIILASGTPENGATISIILPESKPA